MDAQPDRRGEWSPGPAFSLLSQENTSWEACTRAHLHQSGWQTGDWEPGFSDEQWRLAAELTEAGWEAGPDELREVVETA